MSSQHSFKRINKLLDILQEAIALAAPTLSRPELLDLTDQIHEIIRTRHGESFLETPAVESANGLR